MKKLNFCLTFSFLFIGLLFCSLEAVSNVQNNANATSQAKNAAETQEKFNIMKRNEIDDTDVLAIPLDDSEVEDEEEINELEKRREFSLPEKR